MTKQYLVPSGAPAQLSAGKLPSEPATGTAKMHLKRVSKQFCHFCMFALFTA